MKTNVNKENKILFFRINFILFYFFLNVITYLLIITTTENNFLNLFIAVTFAFLFLLPLYVHKNRNYLLVLAGYLWMGFIILFLSIFSILILISYFFDFFKFKEVIYLSLIVGFFLTAYSYCKIDDIKIKCFDIEVEGLNSSEKLKLLHLSDLHWGLVVREKELKKIIVKINNLDADLIVFSGDVIDGQATELELLSNLLKKIKANIAKIVVKGNHECFFDDGVIYKIFNNAGFVLLVNEIFKINDKIAIIGLSEKYKAENFQIDRKMFNILIRHIPIVDEKMSFNLQLSGHTHNGQFFPITILTKLLYKYNSGLYKLKNNRILYVSSGVGTWLPPLRLGSLPEITVFNLKGV